MHVDRYIGSTVVLIHPHLSSSTCTYPPIPLKTPVSQVLRQASLSIMQLIVALIHLLRFDRPILSHKPCAATATELQIRNKLSLYAIAVDTKDFGLLTNFFTEKAVANYSAPPPNDVYHGLPAIQEFLRVSVKDFVSQHAISSTVIDMTNEATPNSTTYVVASFLGQGNLTGQSLAIYGKYTDQWVYDSGSWKTKNRNFTLFVRRNFTRTLYRSDCLPKA